MNIQNDLREQSVFKKEKTQVTSREESAITVISQSISHRNVRNKRNHRASLLLNEDLKVQSDKC